MAKLYDLVEFRNYLIDQLDHLSLEKPIQDKVETLEKTKRIFPQHTDYCDRTIKDYLLLEQQSQETINSIREQISKLNSEIDDVSVATFDNDGYRNNFHENQIQGPEFNNSLILSAESESAIISKITEYSDWHYPALQINPRHKKWIDDIMIPRFLEDGFFDE